MLLLTALTFTTIAKAQYYYYTRQSGDTVFVIKQKKEPEPLRWTRYVYIDRKDRPFRVYQDGDKPKFYYDKKHCIQAVPRKVKRQILEDMARRKKIEAAEQTKQAQNKEVQQQQQR